MRFFAVVNDVGTMPIATLWSHGFGTIHKPQDRYNSDEMRVACPLFIERIPAERYAAELAALNRPMTVGNPECGAPFERTKGSQYRVVEVELELGKIGS